jgi:Mrp family chromosome partitioning ATPase
MLRADFARGEWSDALGEIADALKRAREARPAGDAETAESPSVLPRPVLPGPPIESGGVVSPGTPAPQQAGRVIEDLSSVDPALALADEAALDACRSVAIRLRTMLAKAGAKSFAIVSAARDEGKTTAAMDLAFAMGTLSKEGEVALVDLDLRRPSVAHKLGVHPELGVEQFLLGGAELDDVRMTIRRPSVDVYAAGAPVRNVHELLVSPRFAQLIQELESRHAVVIVDTPPDLVASDSALILEHVAVCVPVARMGFTRMRRFRQLIESLPGHQVLGCLLNDVRSAGSGYYYYQSEERAEPPPSGQRRWLRGKS